MPRYLSEFSQFIYEDFDTFLKVCEAKDEEDYAPTFITEEGGKIPAWNNHREDGWKSTPGSPG